MQAGTNPQSSTKKTISPKQVGIIIIVLVVGLLGWGIYSQGVKNGRAKAAEDAKVAQQKAAQDSLSALPVSGLVSKINGQEITVKLLGAETKTAKIDSKTQVTTKSGNGKISDVKKDSKVILFSKPSGNGSLATRIAIQ